MKKALVVVDFQKDFVDGSLGFSKAAELERAIAQKIELYKANNDTVIFTYDTHDENYLELREGRYLPVPHCIKGTEGWELYGSVADMKDESTPCFEKPTFGSVELMNYLVDNQFEHIEFVGVVSNICVISNAVLAKAALPEADIVVDAACTASNDDSLNEKALDVMQGMHIDVINR